MLITDCKTQPTIEDDEEGDEACLNRRNRGDKMCKNIDRMTHYEGELTKVLGQKLKKDAIETQVIEVIVEINDENKNKIMLD